MKRLVARYPDDLMLASTSAELEKAMKAGKIAGMLGMEGGHSVGSSLAVLRQMYDLGARYMTLTHRSEEHTSELQSLMRISYAVFCLKKKNTNKQINTRNNCTTQTKDRKNDITNRTNISQ